MENESVRARVSFCVFEKTKTLAESDTATMADRRRRRCVVILVFAALLGMVSGSAKADNKEEVLHNPLEAVSVFYEKAHRHVSLAYEGSVAYEEDEVITRQGNGMCDEFYVSASASIRSAFF